MSGQLSVRGVLTFRAGCMLVMVLAMGLAAIWAVRAPLFLQPDERAHFDAIAALFDAGQPFKLHKATAAEDVTRPERYLDSVIDYRRLRYDPTARIRPDYGSPAFVSGFDARAPRPSLSVPSNGAELPYMSFVYPVFYYAIVSVVMRIADTLTHGSLWRDLIAARFVGVAFLGITLFFSIGILRLSGFSRRQTLLALIILGGFPLTSWVSGYMQPDNLSFLLITASTYFSLRFRRFRMMSDILMTSCAVALLFIVKQHYAVCLWIATVAFLVPQFRLRSSSNSVRGLFAIIGMPLTAFALSFHLTYSPGFTYSTGALTRGGHLLSAEHMVVIARDIRDGFIDVYLGGESFRDYWLRFGERGESLYTPALRPYLYGTVIVAAPLCGFLVLVYQTSVYRRLFRIARHRSIGVAIKLALASLPFNIYFTTTALLILAYAISGEALFLEGRYWLPVFVATLIIFARMTFVLPRKMRSNGLTIVLTIVATTVVLAAYSGIGGIERGYYAKPLLRLSTALGTILSVREGGIAAAPDHFMRPHDRLEISGFAVDPRTGYAAEHVFALIDGKNRVNASTGWKCREAVIIYNDAALLHSCFMLSTWIPELPRGAHNLRFFAMSKGLTPLPIHDRVTLNVSS